ncbi:hypothetical protein ACXX9E_26365 [Pseudomonas sp. GNP014]
MHEIERLLEKLDSVRPYRPSAPKTVYEAFLEKSFTYGLATAMVPFAVLCLLAMWHKLYSPLSSGWVTVALWSGPIAQGIALLSFAAPMLMMARTIFSWRDDNRSYRKGEIEHDHLQASSLMEEPANKLELAKQRLELKIKRQERRLGLFMEADAKKTALFSLISLSYAFGNSVTHSDWSKLTATSFTSPLIDQIFVFGMIALLMVSISAIAIKIIANRDTYRIEIIELALSLKNLKPSRQVKRIYRRTSAST